MSKSLGVVFALSLPIFVACSSHDEVARQPRYSSSSAPARFEPSRTVTRDEMRARDDRRVADADNTARNVRDRDGSTLTPFDQSEKKRDLKVTQQIRKSLVKDDSLSTAAKNVKVITVDGEVTLRGPVKSERERAKIVANAKRVAGSHNVDDQLEVEARR